MLYNCGTGTRFGVTVSAEGSEARGMLLTGFLQVLAGLLQVSRRQIAAEKGPNRRTSDKSHAWGMHATVLQHA